VCIGVFVHMYRYVFISIVCVCSQACVLSCVSKGID
jgi:hypothetical protein